FSSEGIYQTNNSQNGYTFIPDGSGAIVRFESTSVNGNKISSSLFGIDNAFYKLETKVQYDWRFPVFGVAQTNTEENVYYQFNKPLTEIIRAENAALDFDYAINFGNGRIIFVAAKTNEETGEVTYVPVGEIAVLTQQVVTTPSPIDTGDTGDNG
ncbi:MAG TPA: hypothetical protein DCY75_00990, partial [Clostridiales bacterium]|nr:hypothetical protein [Clostridiales bacterium]